MKISLISAVFRTYYGFRCRYRLRHRSTRRRFLLITIVFIYFEFPYNVTFKLVYHQRNAFLSTYLKKTTSEYFHSFHRFLVLFPVFQRKKTLSPMKTYHFPSIYGYSYQWLICLHQFIVKNIVWIFIEIMKF